MPLKANECTYSGCFAHNFEALIYCLVFHLPWSYFKSIPNNHIPKNFLIVLLFSISSWPDVALLVIPRNFHSLWHSLSPKYTSPGNPIHGCMHIHDLYAQALTFLPVYLYTLVAMLFPNDIKFLTHIDPTSYCPSLHPWRSVCSS